MSLSNISKFLSSFYMETADMIFGYIIELNKWKFASYPLGSVATVFLEYGQQTC